MAKVENQDSCNCNDEYRILLNCRDLEINQFSTRFNLSLLIQGAIFAFISTSIVKLSPGATFADKLIPLTFNIFALILSIICLRLMYAANFWVDYWEYRLGETEKEKQIGVEIFSNHPSTRNKKRLENLPTHLKYRSFRKTVVYSCRAFIVFWIVSAIIIVFR